MKKIETLINLSRQATENTDFTDSTGIQTEEFIQYFSDAIRRIESVINVSHPRAFVHEKIITLTDDSGEVPIPVDVYMGTRIISVEYSGSTSRNFYILKKATSQERFGSLSSSPLYYIRLGNKILIKPITHGGQVRITYQKAFPAADIRRGILLANGSMSGDNTQLLTFQIDVNNADTLFDYDGLIKQEYVTIVDRLGNVKVANISISSIDRLTGIVTLFAPKTLDSDESKPLAGDYVCAGAYSSNICLLPDLVERYLLSYVNWKIFRRDSNADGAEESQELSQLESDIAASFKEPDSDVDYVAVLDTQFLFNENDRTF